MWLKALCRVLFGEKEGVNVGVGAVIHHFPEQDINVILLSHLEEGVWEPVWAIHKLLTAIRPIRVIRGRFPLFVMP
ncbi:hypothetical protein [Caldilinea sp.]|uniref:hypothetical protein n=1 Tax=Caldilinea sp. TaxID=2293560 RepID=UPI002D145D90|nr:hypothetical protein [Caldilinea sp.]HRA64817.1 hypothetical protein [Caldilinea sp.]